MKKKTTTLTQPLKEKQSNVKDLTQLQFVRKIETKRVDMTIILFTIYFLPTK